MAVLTLWPWENKKVQLIEFGLKICQENNQYPMPVRLIQNDYQAEITSLKHKLTEMSANVEKTKNAVDKNLLDARKSV